MGLLRSELDFTPVDSIIQLGLHEYLDGLQVKMNQIDNSVLSDFMARIPAVLPDQTQSQFQTKAIAHGNPSSATS